MGHCGSLLDWCLATGIILVQTCYGHLQLQWDYDCPGYATPRRQHFTGLLPILIRYVLATLPPQCSLSLRADSTNVLFRAEYLTRKTHRNCGWVHSLGRGSWTVYHGSEHCPKVFALGFLICVQDETGCFRSLLPYVPLPWCPVLWCPGWNKPFLFGVFYHSNRKRDFAAKSKSQSHLKHQSVTSVPGGCKTFAKALATA